LYSVHPCRVFKLFQQINHNDAHHHQQQQQQQHLRQLTGRKRKLTDVQRMNGAFTPRRPAILAFIQK